MQYDDEDDLRKSRRRLHRKKSGGSGRSNGGKATEELCLANEEAGIRTPSCDKLFE